jgi:hypothetical protein
LLGTTAEYESPASRWGREMRRLKVLA